MTCSDTLLRDFADHLIIILIHLMTNANNQSNVFIYFLKFYLNFIKIMLSVGVGGIDKYHTTVFKIKILRYN